MNHRSALRITLMALSLAGCRAGNERLGNIAAVTCSGVPRELEMASTPPYRISPPDILLIETVRDLKPPTAKLIPGDQLLIQGTNLLPIDPEADPIENSFTQISGNYPVEADGRVDLGPEYGRVKVAGLTAPEAYEAIEKHLVNEIGLIDPRISVSLGTPNAPQPVSGEHLVASDGTVNLGLYGSVHVAGATVDEARGRIEAHLSRYVQDPLVRVNVLGYNSRVIYVISDGGGFGERVIRLPHTGNETVLDAIAQVEGLSEVSSKSMWLARPAPAGDGIAQTLPIDWCGITQDGVTATNYQLFPGDRIYIRADDLISLDNMVSKVISPVERVFGVIILGSGMVQRLQGNNIGGGGIGGF